MFSTSFFLLFDHSFGYRSSPWRRYMMAHQGFNSFSKFSSRFFSKEIKYSSSCNPECNSFFRIVSIQIKRIRSKSCFFELAKLIYWAQKFLIFSRINTTITVSYPKGFTWHFIETKGIKHDYYSSLIMSTHINSR